MSPSVLLVDNDPDSVTIYSLILRHHGYSVRVAHDGTSAFNIAVAEKPDLVISEVFLPDEEQGGFMRRFRSDSRLSHTPVIMLNSIRTFEDPEPVGDSELLWLTKPCEPSRLLQAVKRVLSARVEMPTA